MQPIKISDRLRTMLYDAISRELQAVIQYMWQHVVWVGVKGYATRDAFQSIAMQEMRHAEKIAERLFYVARDYPPVTPTPVDIGNDLKAMLERDVAVEASGITLYREIISTAESEGDTATAHLFRGILTEEEEHHDTFVTLMEQV